MSFESETYINHVLFDTCKIDVSTQVLLDTIEKVVQGAKEVVILVVYPLHATIRNARLKAVIADKERNLLLV